jgi:hypothetical protein
MSLVAPQLAYPVKACATALPGLLATNAGMAAGLRLA